MRKWDFLPWWQQCSPQESPPWHMPTLPHSQHSSGHTWPSPVGPPHTTAPSGSLPNLGHIEMMQGPPQKPQMTADMLPNGASLKAMSGCDSFHATVTGCLSLSRRNRDPGIRANQWHWSSSLPPDVTSPGTLLSSPFQSWAFWNFPLQIPWKSHVLLWWSHCWCSPSALAST